METVSSVVSCLGWFLAAFRRKEIPEELAGRWFLERWLLGGKLNTSFGTRNVAWWAASKKKKSRCCGKRQFVETESFCLNACFSKFLSYTNKCPGQLPDGSSRRWSGLDGAYHPVSWPGAGMRHDLRFTAHLGASLWLGHWRPWETARSCRQQAPEILGKVQKKKIIKFWSGVMIFYLFF